jgi:hypothetical protein
VAAVERVRPRKKDNRWGEVDGGRAFIIPYTLLRHPNFMRLSPNAVKLIFDLARQYSGFNNGYMSAALSIMAPVGWKSETTIREAVKECEHYRLIVRTRRGGRNRCNLYALTWHRIDEKPGKLDQFLDITPTLKPRNDWKEDRPIYVPPERKRKAIPRSGGDLPPQRV